MKTNHLGIIRLILILLVCFISCSAMAQKVYLDTLTIDQLNLYKDNAVTMRNAGRIVTLGGLGVAGAGLILANAIAYSPAVQWGDENDAIAIAVISCGLGIASTLVGVPLWAVGGSRKAKAELSLQKYNLVPGGSMALGLGITVRF